ncbi:MAG: hypothetical protein Ct9H300mP1_10630 [Planctomycetaceae bacterium]|nr:MAG: hypothetical protein Ct9H300mP1_10630 [Planctomycetaceae bacterium]
MDSPETAATPPVPFIDLSAQHEPIADELLEAVTRVLDSGQFVLGEEVATLETEIASFCDSRHAVSCASGTDALVLSLMALDIGPGDEVITSPFTFFATAGAIHRVGATPVFVDIESDGFNICPEAAAAAINEKTRAIIPVHLFGHTANMEPLWRLAVQNDLPLIEDACQAIGAEYQGRRPECSAGWVASASSPPRTSEEPATEVSSPWTTVISPPASLNSVCMGTPGIPAPRRRLQQSTRRSPGRGPQGQAHPNRDLDGTTNRIRWPLRSAARCPELDAWVTRPRTADSCRHVYNQYTIRVPASQRDRILGSLREDGIGCAVYYPTPLHLQPCFESLGYSSGSLPFAERAATEVISLPIAPGLDAAARQRVVERWSRLPGPPVPVPGGERARGACNGRNDVRVWPSCPTGQTPVSGPGVRLAGLAADGTR